jgi:ubiquinone/menaquinone biosynthesis C-methylase UbiE
VGDFVAQGRILDIGGGGEGIVGMLKGEQVVAIDKAQQELVEAAEGPLKLVMDARELTFLDEMFNVVTSFFTLMYLAREDHAAVFSEARRVLRPGGRLMIWDVELPARGERQEDIAVFPLVVELPEGLVETGYGILWPEEPLTMSHYVDLAAQMGFDVIKRDRDGHVFSLELLKPFS